MAAPTFIAVNQTASPVVLVQLACTVPASGQITLSDSCKTSEIQNDAQLLALVVAGTLLLNDGTTTLTQAQSIQYLVQVASLGPLKDQATASVAGWMGSGDKSKLDTVPVGAATSAIAESSSSTTTTSGTDTQMSGMQINSSATATYLITFSGDLSHSANNSTINCSIYVGGTLVAASERSWARATAAMSTDFVCMARVSVGAGQAVEGRWRTNTPTATNNRRQLIVQRTG